MKTSQNSLSIQPATRLNPLNDFLFLKIMGEKGDEIQLLSFLNAVLRPTGRKPLVSLQIIESRILSARTMGDKAGVLDVLARLQDGTKVNIEVQIRNKGNMAERSLFYWSREFVKGIKAGQDYIDLPNVISINIIDYDFLDTDNFHTVFHIREDTEPSLLLTEALEIQFINMVKWRKLLEKDIRGDPLQRWLTWLDRSSSAEQIEEVTKMDAAIRKANERYGILSNDEIAQRMYERREMALYDMNTLERTAMRQGMKKGLQKGLRKGRAEGIQTGLRKSCIDIARKMKAMGVAAEQIGTFTGLSSTEIEKL